MKELKVKLKNKIFYTLAIACTLMLCVSIVFQSEEFSILTYNRKKNRSSDITAETWKQYFSDVKKVGKVWTDKSVVSKDITLNTYEGNDSRLKNKEVEIPIEDDDWLVSLSALSDTYTSSNTITQKKNANDIIFLLDTSSSMEQIIPGSSGTDEWLSTLSLNNYVEGESKLLNKKSLLYREPNGKTEEQAYLNYNYYYYDNDHNKVMLYAISSNQLQDTSGTFKDYHAHSIYGTSYFTKMKNLLADFTKSIAEENDNLDKVSYKEKGSRIAFVKFSGNYSGLIRNFGTNGQVVFSWAYYNTKDAVTTSDGKTQGNEVFNYKVLSDKINQDFLMNGTYAAPGLKNVIELIHGRKEEAGKTDFLPPARSNAKKILIYMTDGQNSDDDATPSPADYIKQIKATGTTIYTVGINYASKFLEESATSKDHYYSVSDAEGLTSTFDSILEQITNTNYSGLAFNDHLTFTDKLGDYTEVSTMKKIIYDNKEYNLSNKKEEENKTTYQFNAEVKGSGTERIDANLNDIIITVEKSNNLKDGDLVTVKIPAYLVPTCNYIEENDKINKEENFPIRIIYGVKIKDAIYNNNDANFVNFIKENGYDKEEKTYVNFYSNYFDGKNKIEEETLGNTTATFIPSGNNTYYYEGNKLLVNQENNVKAIKSSVENATTADYAAYSQIKNENVVTYLGNNGVKSLQFTLKEESSEETPNKGPIVTIEREEKEENPNTKDISILNLFFAAIIAMLVLPYSMKKVLEKN